MNQQQQQQQQPRQVEPESQGHYVTSAASLGGAGVDQRYHQLLPQASSLRMAGGGGGPTISRPQTTTSYAMMSHHMAQQQQQQSENGNSGNLHSQQRQCQILSPSCLPARAGSSIEQQYQQQQYRTINQYRPSQSLVLNGGGGGYTNNDSMISSLDQRQQQQQQDFLMRVQPNASMGAPSTISYNTSTSYVNGQEQAGPQSYLRLSSYKNPAAAAAVASNHHNAGHYKTYDKCSLLPMQFIAPFPSSQAPAIREHHLQTCQSYLGPVDLVAQEVLAQSSSAASTSSPSSSVTSPSNSAAAASAQQQNEQQQNENKLSSDKVLSSVVDKKNKHKQKADGSSGQSCTLFADSSATSGGGFSAHLTQLILASNVPFAYTIILVAFLITMIAATSIITILTIILTLTGYTAYPITENTFNTSLAIGIVCASFALVLVTGSLIVWRRHCQAAYYYLDEPQDASRATNSPQLSETYDDSEYGSIPVNDWLKHVQKLHADSDIGFAREFEQIQQANQKQSAGLSCDHSQLSENKHKNRYINIVAYDHTRVTLRPPLGGQKKPGYDYINANFIDGYNKPRAYIGTQGPLVSTFDDYWRMIWEQRVVIIVMITNLQERGRRKCDMYWPKEGTETYGYVQVKLLQEVVMATYTLRTFTVRNLKIKKRSGSDRTVYQYHYTNWPDHGVPDHPLPVLSFVRKSAKANPPGAGAIICHCSAGCGRSGTYIVIDAMLKQIRHKQSINVVDFLKHIRAQRNYLVQTEEQYVFIHDALVEAIESGETEIPSNLIGKYIQFLQTGGLVAVAAADSNGGFSKQQLGSNYSLMNGLCQSPLSAGGGGAQLSVSAANEQPQHQQQQLISTSNSNLLIGVAQPTLNTNQKSATSLANSQATTVSRSQSGAGAQWSLLERQYRLVASFKAKDFCVVSALKPCNKIKNRTLNLIPLEAHRVHITPKPGADGSDYINATFLMGFNHLHEFIATQHPVQETFSDFWQMVYDHNSQTIVLLTQMNSTGSGDSKEFPQFWPQKEDEVDYGSFKVKLTQESTLMKAENGGLIITRDFIMRSNQDDYELQTRIIHCPGWPECCGPLSAVFDLIQVVQQATQQQASQHQLHDGAPRSGGTVTIGQEHEPQNGGPIIVVDKFGGTEAATFAVLTTLFKQINFEDAVDVYMYAKLAHLRRPGIWSSQDDYLFLYRAMENYASSLLQARQQQASASSADGKQVTAASLSAPLSYANLHHHQTMTLDRRRAQKSSPSLTGGTLKSSTMRRNTSSHKQQPLQQQHQQQQHNQPQQQQQQQHSFMHHQPVTHTAAAAPHLMVMSSQQQLHHTIGNEFMMAHKQNQIHQLQQVDHNHNTLQYSPAAVMQQTNGNNNNNNNNSNSMMMHNTSNLSNNNNKQMPKGSPYNSAASIGASSHQHLLAANTNSGGRPVAAVSANQAHNQTNDHYNLYSVQ